METTVDDNATETTTTAPETTTGKGAFAAARASLSAQSKDQGSTEIPEPEPEESPEETPAQEPDKPADEPPEAGENEDALLSPQEIAKLKGPARAQYDALNKVWTTKTQALAAKSKEFEPWNPLIEALKSNPDAAIEQLAKQRGLTVSKPKAPEAEAVADDEIPAELMFLKPLLDARDRKVEARIRKEFEPVLTTQNDMVTKAVAAETMGTLASFDAAHPGWKKHEPKMLELGKKFVPAPGAMTDLEYMGILYQIAQAGETEAEKTKKVIAKLNKVTESSEEVTPGIEDNRVEHVMPTGLTNSASRFKAAFKAAKQGIRWTT